MRTAELFEQKTVFSLEVFPPKPDVDESVIYDTLEQLSDIRPDFISVTFGAGGTTQGYTAEIAEAIEQSGTTALAHLTCVRSTTQALNYSIQNLKEKKISNVLALRGDFPKDAVTGENIFPSGSTKPPNGIARI